jgi:hypothetical protein
MPGIGLIRMAEKYFTLHEAQELLLFIAPHLEQARDRKRQMDKLDEELSRASAEIMILGGSIPPRKQLAQTRLERDRLATELKESVSRVAETGCLIKDLEVGLVDFPALLKGEEVYLCWKLGEERIEYWHRVHEGFAGRRLIGGALPDDEPPGGSRIH